MDLPAAKTRVQIWIAEHYRWANHVPQILDDETIEHGFGWVFFFRNPSKAIPRRYEDIDNSGFPPVAINREDGSIKIWRPN